MATGSLTVETLQQEVQELREQILEGQEREAMFLRRISRLQAQNVERAAKLGDMATAHEKAKRWERRAQEIGFIRARSLRSASDRAAVELDFSIPQSPRAVGPR